MKVVNLVLQQSCNNPFHYHNFIIENQFLGNQTLFFNVTYNGLKVFDFYINSNEHNYSRCILTGNYSVELNNVFNVPITLLTYVSGVKMTPVTFPLYSKMSKILYTHLEYPIIEYSQKEYIIEIGKEYNIKPSFSRYIQKFIIEPKYLPDGFYFDELTGEININLRSLYENIFTIYAVNDYGTSTKNILQFHSSPRTESVNCFSEGNIYLNIIFHTIDQSCVNFQLSDISYNIIWSNQGSGNNITEFSICTKPGTYIIRISKSNCLNWQNEYIEITQYDFVIRKLYLSYEDPPTKTLYINCIIKYIIVYNIIDSTTEWYLSYNYYNDWNKVVFNCSKWNIMNTEDPILLPTNQRLYFRKQIMLNNKADYPSFTFVIKTVYQFNLYIEGRLIYNSSEKEQHNITTIIIPTYLLGDYFSTFGIELYHLIDIKKIYYEKILLWSGITYDEDFTSTLLNQYFFNIDSAYVYDYIDYNNIKNGFNGNPDNSWVQELSINGPFFMNLSLIYSLGYNAHFFVNKITISKDKNSDDNTAIKGIIFEGYDEISWELLYSNDNIIYSKETDEFNIYLPKSCKPYLQIRINITDIYEYSKNNNILSVGNINFYETKDLSCNSIENYLPYGEPEKNYTLKCNNSDNYRVFYCEPSEFHNWIEIENNCNSIPEILFSYNSYEFVVGVNNNVLLFAVSGKNCQFTINPSILLFI